MQLKKVLNNQIIKESFISQPLYISGPYTEDPYCCTSKGETCPVDSEWQYLTSNFKKVFHWFIIFRSYNIPGNMAKNVNS